MQVKNSRFKEFKIWLLQNDLTISQFADAIEVSPSRMAAIIKSERVSQGMHEKLLAVGIPACFVPEITEYRQRKRKPLPHLESAIPA